jgi:DNA mismatch endonuclease (patch repair protein)
MASGKKTRNALGRNLKSASKADAMTPDTRSRLMSKVKSSDTKLEAKFIEELRGVGVKNFELQARDIIGKPDVVFRDSRLCVFVDSDFWHGWQFPRWKHKLRSEFWTTKIAKNREHDVKVTRQLRREGWKVIRIWEHQLNACPEKSVSRVKTAIEKTCWLGELED